MPRGIENRTVTPITQAFRNVIRGKPVVESLRFTNLLAARTQPQPKVPGGPYHKTSKVYYFSRDARRLVQPPIQVYEQKHIDAGKKPATDLKAITPGKAIKIH
ncbi:NADH dehydrogenase [ubiquinone] 1 alpha subcomplex subunit 7 [Lasioglossum baleicum]|uniref:NADH dehydrogenase [ubiquinone] 1 alpha subcomplex subunit 7 n=1 Tax=Lasioglossum baleicum TaxID=434251 RepID=UPI003FCE188C